MATDAQVADRRQLRELAPDRIRRNPDNPRLFFRLEEMEHLWPPYADMESRSP